MTDKEVVKALRVLLAYAPDKIDQTWAKDEITHLTAPQPGQQTMLCDHCGTPLAGSYTIRAGKALCGACR